MTGQIDRMIQIPVQDGSTIPAVVAQRNGICEVMLNDVPHIGLLLAGAQATALAAVMTHQEASELAAQLSISALTLARRLGDKLPPRTRRDVSQLKAPTRLHADDIGSELFEVLDEAGQPVRDVHEVNADEGWALVLNKDEDGAPVIANDQFTYVRVRGRFTIQRRAV